MKMSKALLCAACALAGMSAPALAQDNAAPADATQNDAAQNGAVLQGDVPPQPNVAQGVNTAPPRFKHWIVRLRAIRVTPTEHTGPISPTFAGTNAHTAVSNNWMPELDVTYMFTPHIGAEIIASSTKHDISGRGALEGLGKLAHARVLPPVLTLQYHFNPESSIRPYFGVGVNYSIFFNETADKSLNDALGRTKVGLRDTVGYALQAGVDVDITKKIFLNLDLKYIEMHTRAYLDTTLADGSVLHNRERVHLNPLVPAVGIGMRF